MRDLVLASLAFVAALLVALSRADVIVKEYTSLDPIASFVAVDYDWNATGGTTRQEAIASGMFVVANNIITGINAYRDNVYVSVPRWFSGVPSTLNKLVVGADGRHVLQPFPNWEWQRKVLHYVQSMFTDPDSGNMWIIDTGRENIFETPINRNAGLYIYNLNEGKQLYNWTFPDEILPINTSFLNDIVVDVPRDRAYMTDTNMAGKGALVAFNKKTGFMRRFEDPNSTYAESDVVIEINGIKYPQFASPVDGIALSADGSTVYYSSVKGQLLHAISADMLVDPLATFEDLRHSSRMVFNKRSPSDGLMFLPLVPTPLIAYGACNDDLLAVVDVETHRSYNVFQNNFTMQWLDSFALAPVKDGYDLYFTTNRLQLFLTRTMDYNGANGSNMRIWRAHFSKSDEGENEDVDYKARSRHLLIAVAVLGLVVVLLFVGIVYMHSKLRIAQAGGAEKSLLNN